MDVSNFWWQSAGGGPGPGTGIGESLRFRGNQSLTRTVTSSTTGAFTISMWVNRATLGQSFNYLYNAWQYDGAVQGDVLIYNTTDNLGFQKQGGNQGVYSSTPIAYRDPAAWYHIVWVLTAGAGSSPNNFEIYVNGVQQPNTGNFDGTYCGAQRAGCVLSFGNGIAGNGTAGTPFEGYMAEVHAIDGQALTPEVFAYFNEDGVWVPKEYEGTYGTNGWHLDFSDPANIGADRSGNGNDFTPTGFELADQSSTNYDSMFDSPTQNYSTQNPLGYPGGSSDSTYFTDANLNTNVPVSGLAIFYPSFLEVPETGKYKFETTGTGSIQRLNFADKANITRATPVGGASTGNSFCTQIADGNWYSHGGTLFPTMGNTQLGGDDNYVCLIDADNKNVYVGNGTNWLKQIPINSPTGLGTVSNGPFDLATPTFTYSYVADKGLCIMDGVNTSTTPAGSEGLYNYGQIPFKFDNPGFVGLQTQNLPEAPIPNGRDHFQAITGSGDGAGITPGPNQRTGNFIKDLYSNEDGTYNSSITDRMFYVFGGAPSDGHEVFDGNRDSTVFGGDSSVGGNWMYFKPDPPIDIESSLQITTAQMQTLRINGGTPTGDQVSTDTLTDVNISNPPTVLTELAIQGNVNKNIQMSRIVVDGETLIDIGILSYAQNTFPNGLWWIKDRANSNQHQFVDSVRGGNLALQCPASGADTAYVAPSGNSVAWCWDAPQTATISAGSIGAGVPVVNSNVGTNTLAGFSIVTWQADGSNDGGVAHGLDRKPEFIIYKARNVTNPFQIWYSAGGQNKFLLLSGNAAGSDIDTSIYSEPTADTISNYQNANGVQMVAYCWHSVPGYSAFGSYQGNSSADGPFIYTGFRPAFVMLKKTSSTGGSWVITDTTRSISNPVDEMLFANNDVGEIVSPSYVIDILSNGFKPRVADDNLNSAGNTYIYAAFAENPFGGSNVSPANAR